MRTVVGVALVGAVDGHLVEANSGGTTEGVRFLSILAPAGRREEA